MKKVIVLGANGQLGKTIQDLAELDINEFCFFTRNDVDIIDTNSLTTAFNNADFDYCINCAAYTNVEEAEKNPAEAFLINAKGVQNIAEVCASHQVKLIHISTDYVFDGEKRSPYCVDDETGPINQYGKSKLQGELNIQEQLKEFYIIRTSWLYSLHGKNFLKTIIDKIKNDAILNITTEEEGTPTSCLDLAEFILQIIKKDTIPYGIYNFSANGSATWYEFAKAIAKSYNALKTDNIKPSSQFKTRAKRPKYSVFDLSKTEYFYQGLNLWQKSVGNMVEKYKLAISNH